MRVDGFMNERGERRPGVLIHVCSHSSTTTPPGCTSSPALIANGKRHHIWRPFLCMRNLASLAVSLHPGPGRKDWTAEKASTGRQMVVPIWIHPAAHATIRARRPEVQRPSKYLWIALARDSGATTLSLSLLTHPPAIPSVGRLAGRLVRCLGASNSGTGTVGG